MDRQGEVASAEGFWEALTGMQNAVLGCASLDGGASSRMAAEILETIRSGRFASVRDGSEPWGDSQSAKVGREMETPLFYRDYKLPGSLDAAGFERLAYVPLQLCWRMDMKANPNRYKVSGRKVQNERETTMAREWMNEFAPGYKGWISSMSSELARLNPELPDVLKTNGQRLGEKNESSEAEFVFGVMYRRNPDDISWYLETRHAATGPAWDASGLDGSTDQGRRDMLDFTQDVQRGALALLSAAAKESGRSSRSGFYFIMSPATFEKGLEHWGKAEYSAQMERLGALGKRVFDEGGKYKGLGITDPAVFPKWLNDEVEAIKKGNTGRISENVFHAPRPRAG